MESYQTIRQLSHTSAAQVFLVEERSTYRRYVMKQLHLSRDERENALRESELLSSLHHPNICRHHESFIHDGSWLCVVMPHCSNGDLAQLLKHRRAERQPPLDEPIAVHYVMCLSLALEYLHARKIIHRDVKPSNVFLTADWTVQLGDFGVSRQLSDASSLASTTVGTPLYMSPELLMSNKYSTKTDMWALGCVAFECVTLKSAFMGSSFSDITAKVIAGEYGRLPARTTMPFRDTVRRLLSVDPEERPSAKQLLSSLLLRRPLRTHMARLEAGEAGAMSAALEEALGTSAAGAGGATGATDCTASSAPRAAGSAFSTAQTPPRAGGDTQSVPTPPSASGERLQRALDRRHDVQRYLDETQQRRRRRRRAESTSQSGPGVSADASASLGRRRSSQDDPLQSVHHAALRMLDTGAATDYQSAVEAASSSDARADATVRAAVPRASATPDARARGEGARRAAGRAEAADGDDFDADQAMAERTLGECELAVQLLQLGLGEGAEEPSAESGQRSGEAGDGTGRSAPRRVSLDAPARTGAATSAWGGPGDEDAAVAGDARRERGSARREGARREPPAPGGVLSRSTSEYPAQSPTPAGSRSQRGAWGE